MYAMQLHIYSSKSYPLFGSAFYGRTAERYQLPTLRTLLSSLNNEVDWNSEAQVYYLENLREQNSSHVFQVRFFSSEQSRDFTSIFLSVQDNQVHTLTAHFPTRGDRKCSSFMIEDLKQIAHELGTRDIPFLIEGFMEVGNNLHFIREQKLSAFVWIEGIQRYLHIKENPRLVKEVQKQIFPR